MSSIMKIEDEKSLDCVLDELEDNGLNDWLNNTVVKIGSGLTIGIDIDGTITEAYSWISDLNRVYGTKLKNSDCIHYNIKELVPDLDWTYVDPDTGYTMSELFLRSGVVRKNAYKVIHDMDKEFKLHILTARYSDCKQTMDATHYFLMGMGLGHIPLTYSKSKNKVEECQLLKIDVMIEDNPHNAIAMAESGITVILLDCFYNRNVNHKNIIRIKSWSSVYQIINKM